MTNILNRLQSARRALNAADSTEALEVLEPTSAQFQEVEHHRKQVALIRALAHWENGNLKDSIAEASLFLAFEEVDSTETPADQCLVRHTRGKAHFGIGTLEKAIEDFDHALQLFQQRPDEGGDATAKRAEVHADRGRALLQLGKADEAIAAFQNAHELMPENLEPLYHLAALYAKKGELQTAVEKFSDACEIAPSNPDVWYNRGCAYAELSRYEEAESDFSRAIALRVDDYVYYHNRAVVKRKLGKRDADNDWIIRCYLYPPGEPDMDKEDLIQPGDGAS